MGLYVGNTKYKVMSGNNKASLFQVYPYDSEVEYLRNSGLAYIVIQTASLPTYKKEICFEKTSGFTTSSYTSVTGCFDTTTLNLWFNNAACVFNYKGKENTFSINVPVNTRCVATINGNALSLEFGGSTYSYTGSAGTNTSSTNVRLFSGNSGRPGVYSIYHYKMWNDNDELILDLIPVRVGTTGYMYDRVSGKLFGNSGTGSFVLGPDKPIYDAEVEYLESDGGTYIDTGIVATQNTKIQWVGSIPNYLQSEYGHWFFGYYGSTIRFGAFYNQNTNKLTFYRGNSSQAKTLTLAEGALELNSINDSSILIITNNGNSYSITRSANSFETPSSIFLFTVNVDGGPALLNNKSGTKLSSCKILQGTSVVLDLIPVRIGTTGYMYDTISHKLFGNAGTGQFIIGPDK